MDIILEKRKAKADGPDHHRRPKPGEARPSLFSSEAEARCRAAREEVLHGTGGADRQGAVGSLFSSGDNWGHRGQDGESGDDLFTSWDGGDDKQGGEDIPSLFSSGDRGHGREEGGNHHGTASGGPADHHRRPKPGEDRPSLFSSEARRRAGEEEGDHPGTPWEARNPFSECDNADHHRPRGGEEDSHFPLHPVVDDGEKNGSLFSSSGDQHHHGRGGEGGDYHRGGTPSEARNPFSQKFENGPRRRGEDRGLSLFSSGDRPHGREEGGDLHDAKKVMIFTTNSSI